MTGSHEVVGSIPISSTIFLIKNSGLHDYCWLQILRKAGFFRISDIKFEVVNP